MGDLKQKDTVGYYEAPIKNVLNYWLDYGMEVLSVSHIEGNEYSITVQNGINVSRHKAEESLHRAIPHAIHEGYNITVWDIVLRAEGIKPAICLTCKSYFDYWTGKAIPTPEAKAHIIAGFCNRCIVRDK